MKILTDRKDIGRAMNFNKYPVLVLDMENRPMADIKPDSKYCVGQKVKVAWDRPDGKYAGMTTRGNIYMSDDKIAISGNCSCLTNSFGYNDVMEDAEWANAPTVHKGQTVVVIMKWASDKICVVRMMRVSERIDIHCQTVAELMDIDE